MSRGHDPAHRLGPADADVAEQLAIGDEHEAVRAAREPAVEAPVDDGHRARRRRLGDRVRDAGRQARLLEHLREARCLVRRDHDPRLVAALRAVLRAPALHGLGDPGAASRRELRLSPAEQVAGRLAAARDRVVRLGLPGQLQGARAEQAALPVSRREERRAASPSAARSTRGGPRAARRPGATGTRRPRRCRRARR